MFKITFDNSTLDNEFNEELEKLIKLKMKELGKTKVMWACIGEPSVPFDSIGPILGTNLSNEGFNVIGTASDPLNVTGLKRNCNLLEKLHDEYLVVAIDAGATTDPKDMNRLSIRDIGVKPGAGVGQDIPRVGHLSILATTAVTSRYKVVFKLDYLSINKIITNLTNTIKNIEEDGLNEKCYSL